MYTIDMPGKPWVLRAWPWTSFGYSFIGRPRASILACSAVSSAQSEMSEWPTFDPHLGPGIWLTCSNPQCYGRTASKPLTLSGLSGPDDPPFLAPTIKPELASIHAQSAHRNCSSVPSWASLGFSAQVWWLTKPPLPVSFGLFQAAPTPTPASSTLLRPCRAHAITDAPT